MGGACGYELEELLGRGSMGAVYRGRSRASGEAVALKRVPWAGDAAVIERLRQEAATLVGLGHPHIVRVLEVRADEEGLIVVMQLAGGGSLAELLRRRGRLPPDEGAALLAKVADALAAAHARSILHADLKPSNVLIDAGAEPVLADFGLSRWVSGASQGDRALCGTAEYLDPAVARGGGPSVASDVYSLGAVCYEALAGRLPYRGPTPLAVIRAADRGRLEPLAVVAPALPRALADLVEGAMARRPQARPSTAGELAAGLRSAIPAASSHVGPSRLAAGDDRSAEGAGTTEGPRPLRPRRRPSGRPPEVALAARHSSAALVALGAAVVLTVLLGARWVVGTGGGGHRAGDPCRVATAPPAHPAGPGSGLTVLADVAGNGCQMPVTWSSGTVTVAQDSGRPPIRFALGQAGDELVLGDWYCGRRATPALYRPSTGQVFYFAAWAQPGHDLAPSAEDSTSIADGVPRVVRDGARGCDRVEVAPSAAHPS